MAKNNTKSTTRYTRGPKEDAEPVRIKSCTLKESDWKIVEAEMQEMGFSEFSAYARYRLGIKD